MSEKKSFIMYMDQLRLINKLSDEEAGKLLKAVYEYQATGEMAELPPAADMLFSVICNQLDRDNEKWARTVERRAEAGRNGGKAKAENSQLANASKSKQMLANASKSKQTLANVADNDNDNDNENDNDNGNENENDNDNDSAGEPRADESPPAPEPAPDPEAQPDNTVKKPRGTKGKVMLTEAEYERLQLVRPNDWEAKLEYFDWYLDTHPDKQYENQLETIIRWAEMDDKKRPKPSAQDTSVHFDLEKVNKGKYGDIFLDIFSPEAEAYIKDGTWPYKKADGGAA